MQQKGPQIENKYDANPNLPPQVCSSPTNDSLKTPTILPQTLHHTSSPQKNDKHIRDSAIIIIRLEADLSKKFVTSLSFILTENPLDLNMSDRGGGDLLLYKASYEKLFQSLSAADSFLTADSGDKLWGFVPGGGIASGWWRIRADSSLRACLHAQQQACSDNITGRFIYVINQGSSYFLCSP